MSWATPFVNLALRVKDHIRRSDFKRRRWAETHGGSVTLREKFVTETDPETGAQIKGRLLTDAKTGEQKFIPVKKATAAPQSDAEQAAADNPTTREMKRFVDKANKKLAAQHTPQGAEPLKPPAPIPAEVTRPAGKGSDTTVPAAPGGVALSDDTPEDLGEAAAGTSAKASRSDHIHDTELPSYGTVYQVMQRSADGHWVVDDVRMTA